jgi:serine protease Do
MQMKLSRKIKYAATIFAVLAIIAGSCIVHDIPSVTVANATTDTSPASQPLAPKATITLPDFATIVSQQGPAVVNISVSGTIKTAMPGIPGMQGMDPSDPFFEFFHRFQMPAPQGGTPTRGLGSGFIVSKDGIILTNAHVVADANEVIVKLLDKREFKAKVIGMDKVSDVAVLKIDAINLPTIHTGDPQNARVGEWVLAIGSPFGFENTVTAGIISAKSRTLPDEGYVPFLQTDVAVNPGNSGGPLINTSGEVIGINSQIFSRSGGYQGLSFAIPIDVAMKVEQQILDHGSVSHGRLGVEIQEVNQQLADTFGLEKPEGALVSSVVDKSPAEKAGIVSGDVILKFNGKNIASSADLPPLVSEQMPGNIATLQVWRKSKLKDLTIKIGKMEVASNEVNTDSLDKGKLGLAVRALTAQERKQAEINQGLLVENVDDGPAARAGVMPGDIILSVDQEQISNPKQLNSLLTKGKKHVALLIQRGNQKLFVAVNIG